MEPVIRYVVDIVEPRDPELGTGGYARRFTFDTEAEAWHACIVATQSGFSATCERVSSRKLATSAKN